MKKLLIMLVMALFAWGTEVSHAQKPAIVLSDEAGWTHIGETVASFKSEDESIMVMGADEFSAIKIKVEHAPLEIERLQVFYASGEMEEIEVKEKIQAGEESGVFQLENPESSIQKVAFTYNTAPNSEGEKADVELWGLKLQDEDKASDAYRDDAERIDEAADDVERETEEAGEDIERESAEAADDVEHAADEAGEDIARETEEAGDDIEQGAERTESDLERAAEATGDAIAETAAKGAAEITDKRHDTKVGPNGQVIYIDDDTKYYYVNDQGKRVFVSEWQLKDKPEKD